MSFVEPVTLTGVVVELTPLTAGDHDDLVRAASDGQLWRSTVTTVPDPDSMATAIGGLLRLRDEGSMQPFVVRRLADRRVVGATSFCNVDGTHRRVEIGHTWYAASAQRSGVNADAKRLLLGHAFDTLGCLAVELRTHVRNLQSRGAIERLGARQDGILRHHRIMPDGSLRDTVVYSILAQEWPRVRQELDARLGLRRDAPGGRDTPELFG